jgi:hypothetical protein
VVDAKRWAEVVRRATHALKVAKLHVAWALIVRPPYSSQLRGGVFMAAVAELSQKRMTRGSVVCVETYTVLHDTYYSTIEYTVYGFSN